MSSEVDDIKFVKNFVLILFVLVVSFGDQNDTTDEPNTDTISQGEGIDD